MSGFRAGVYKQENCNCPGQSLGPYLAAGWQHIAVSGDVLGISGGRRRHRTRGGRRQTYAVCAFREQGEPAASVLRKAFDRVGAANFAALDALPDRPENLEAALLEFARELVLNLYHDPDTLRLRRFLRMENAINPDISTAAREHDRPQRDRLADALAGRLARLAYAGYLKLDDPDRAIPAQCFRGFRPVALTRKNALFAGHEVGAEIARCWHPL
ncbi:hypothetical protein GCM10010869_23010 [Mesorhizobium tianshanense]|nr:hypothetical protein GCM10010869_23010 [Mesorhizobium tianshanense]